MPDVRLPSFSSSKPVNAHLVRSALASDASSALRLSAFADPSPPKGTDRRQPASQPHRSLNTQLGPSAQRRRHFLSRPANDLPALGLRRFPSLAHRSSPHRAPPPEPGASPSVSGFVGRSSPRFTRAAQHPHSKGAASQHAPEFPSPPTLLGSLTPACSGLAALAADARR